MRIQNAYEIICLLSIPENVSSVSDVVMVEIWLCLVFKLQTWCSYMGKKIKIAHLTNRIYVSCMMRILEIGSSGLLLGLHDFTHNLGPLFLFKLPWNVLFIMSQNGSCLVPFPRPPNEDKIPTTNPWLLITIFQTVSLRTVLSPKGYWEIEIFSWVHCKLENKIRNPQEERRVIRIGSWCASLGVAF